MKRTTVYIDGFNLYYGLYKSKNRRSSLTAYKWLDIGRLCHRLLPRDLVQRIRYFTADVSATPKDPDQPVRQQTYLRALETVSHLVIHKGKFISTTKKGIPVDAKKYGLDLIEVRLFEEKGSDVNIATYLLLDAFRGACDKAVLISNDLKVVSTRSGPLEPRLVMQCQFPPTLVDAHGNQILKPRNW